MAKDFKIGADPELGFRDEHAHIRSDGVLRGRGTADGFGLDGAGHISEIRPAPDRDPEVVVKNIRTLMQEALDSYPHLRFVEWTAAACVTNYGTALGGHIHFGTANILVPSIGWMVYALDALLAYPVAAVSDPYSFKERVRSSYGKLSDKRDQPHGLEYRTLASWLHSPKAALACLSLAKAIVWEHIYNKEFNNLEFFPTSLREYFSLSSTMKSQAVSAIPIIQKLHLYEEYKPHIDFLLDHLRAGSCWHPTNDVKTTWELKLHAVKMPKMIIRRTKNVQDWCISELV